MVRLQKFLAEAGVASRRAAEQLIVAGRVEVNGKAITQLGARVDPATERVTVDGRPIKAQRKLYVAINKPKGYICTRNDPEKRRIITDLLPREWRNLYPVGRLDHDTEGLIFLTNDGDFALRLTHPRYGTQKIYRVTVEGRVEPRQLRALTAGIFAEEQTFLQKAAKVAKKSSLPSRSSVKKFGTEGEMLKAARTRLVSANNTRSVVEVELLEGRNREIRRMFKALGFDVSELQRTQIGRIKLGELPTGKWRTLTEPEIKSLLPKL